MFVLHLPVLSQIITDLILDWSEYSNAKTRNEAFRTCRSTQLTAGTHFTLTPSTLHLSCVATKDHGLGVLHCRRGLWGARGMQVWGKASSGTFNINLRASSTQKALTLAFFFSPQGTLSLPSALDSMDVTHSLSTGPLPAHCVLCSGVCLTNFDGELFPS